jgi:hypothetical protein
MEDAQTELAGYFQGKFPLLDEHLLKLVSAARTAGHQWTALAAACEPGSEIEEPAGILGTGAAGRLFRRVYDASEAIRHGPPSWRCPDYRHSVTDLGPLAGQPISSSATPRPAPGWPVTRPPTTRSAARGSPP